MYKLCVPDDYKSDMYHHCAVPLFLSLLFLNIFFLTSFIFLNGVNRPQETALHGHAAESAQSDQGWHQWQTPQRCDPQADRPGG